MGNLGTFSVSLSSTGCSFLEIFLVWWLWIRWLTILCLSGKDLIGVQNLLKKHQALQAEIAGHEPRIKAVTQKGNAMVEEGMSQCFLILSLSEMQRSLCWTLFSGPVQLRITACFYPSNRQVPASRMNFWSFFHLKIGSLVGTCHDFHRSLSALDKHIQALYSTALCLWYLVSILKSY